MLVAVLFGPAVNGTHRWFGIGGLGIQPSELAKVACVLFTGLILERRMHRIDDPSYSLLPIALVVGLVVGLILLAARFRHVDVARRDRGHDGICRRAALPVPRRR